MPISAQLCPSTVPPTVPPCVLTSQYTNMRQGYNNAETVLTPTEMQNGGPTQPSWSPLKIDSPPSPFTQFKYNGVWAQPLYVAGISAQYPANTGNCNDNNTGKCNMLVVATLTGSVFAFNAGGSSTTAGTTIWSRQGSGTSGALYHDCDPGGVLAGTVGKFQLAGIGSTPVIDVSGSTPVMYVVSECSNSSGKQIWLHKMNLQTGADIATTRITGSVPGSSSADDLSGSTIMFQAYEVYSRSGLLEVNLPGASTSPLIYLTFGSAGGENYSPYHGWIFGYDSTLTQQVVFATTTQGCDSTNRNTPTCNPDCFCSGGFQSCTPKPPSNPYGCFSDLTCCIPNTGTSPAAPYNYNTAQNWVGHSGGVWTDGRAPAAYALGSGSSAVSHAYFVSGNGGFQQWQHDGTTRLTSIQNWGETLMDFTLSSSAFDTSPSQYWTPFGGGPLGPPSGYGNGLSYTFAGLNQNDFDLGTSGMLLFTDSSGTGWLLTCDKAGYCYMLQQGDLCGPTSTGCYPGSSNGQLGFASKDSGVAFLFGANRMTYPLGGVPVTGVGLQCQDGTSDTLCDRITSLAFYPGSSDGTVLRLLIYWPSFEPLTTLQLSDNGSKNPGTNATITTNGTTVNGTNTHFLSQVVPGDQITTQTLPSEIMTITNVASDTSLTVASVATQLTSPTAFFYNGYFIKPDYDLHPVSNNVEYPGGVVEVTDNNGTNALIYGLSNVNVGTVQSPVIQGALFVYNTSLNLLWCTLQSCTSNTSAFTLGTNGNTAFGPPTIANGYIYIPNYGVTAAASNSSTCPNPSTTPCSGVVVYSAN